MPATEALRDLLLAALHLGVGFLRLLEGVPRSRRPSLAGGAAVTYVFVRLRPDVAAGDEAVGRSGVLISRERHAFARPSPASSRSTRSSTWPCASRDRTGTEGDARAGDRVLWVHLLSFGADNVLVGHLRGAPARRRRRASAPHDGSGGISRSPTPACARAPPRD